MTSPHQKPQIEDVDFIRKFHGRLLSMMEGGENFRLNPDLPGYKLMNAQSQALLAQMYSEEARLMVVDKERLARASDESAAMGQTIMAGYGSNPAVSDLSPTFMAHLLRREAQEARAERDLWSLLEILTKSELLCDLNADECEASLQQAMAALTERSTISDVINAAYRHDARTKKGRVLLEWLETAANDRVTNPPEYRGEPWGTTLATIVREKKNTNSYNNTSRPAASSLVVPSMHPDAQLTSDGRVLALEGNDCHQQESLLTTIWQLLRCGNMKRAQELAVENRLFWLAASLLGHSNPFYDYTNSADNACGDQQNMDPSEDHPMNLEGLGGGVVKKGNVRRPLWLRTCWKYAQKLEANPANWGVLQQQPGAQGNTASGLLEMSIYASLSCHLKVLARSPLLSLWSDRLWAVVKSAHERDLLRVLHVHRKSKAAYSGRFPGCEKAVLTAEQEMLQWINDDLGHVHLGDGGSLFAKVASMRQGMPVTPVGSTGSTATLSAGRGYAVDGALLVEGGGSRCETLLLQLQASAMEGKSGLRRYVDTVFTALLSTPSEQSFPGVSRVLRVYAHLALWMHTSAEGKTDLEDLMPLDLVQLAVETYVQHLITEGGDRGELLTLVSTYCLHLTAPRRVAVYTRLLLSLTPSLPAEQHRHVPDAPPPHPTTPRLWRPTYSPAPVSTSRPTRSSRYCAR
jgi:hypothetical protein